MTALDTNVIVRLIVRDDAEQAARAAALVRGAPCWVPKSVILETEWVLRAAYRYTPDQVCEAFEALTAMVNIELDEPEAVTSAVLWHRAGLDFAEALHLAASQSCERFATFDARLRSAASRLKSRATAVEPHR